MTDPSTLLCPCGAPAPARLPSAGTAPLRCRACAAPLVAPGGVGRAARERGAAAGVLAAVVCTFAWVVVSRAAASGVHVAIPVAALVVAWAVRVAARARSTDLRWIALAAAVVFLVLGELLLYRHALLDRLIAMHAAEGAPDAAELGDREHDGMTAAKYLHIELDLGWWASVSLAAALVWRTLAPPPAVPAFSPGEVPQLEDESFEQDAASSEDAGPPREDETVVAGTLSSSEPAA